MHFNYLCQIRLDTLKFCNVLASDRIELQYSSLVLTSVFVIFLVKKSKIMNIIKKATTRLKYVLSDISVAIKVHS